MTDIEVTPEVLEAVAHAALVNEVDAKLARPLREWAGHLRGEAAEKNVPVRAELAELISRAETPGRSLSDQVWWRQNGINAAADAVLAAGYRKPRTVTTVAELDALPITAVILHDAEAYQTHYVSIDDNEGGDAWFDTEGVIHAPEELLPALVIWDGAHRCRCGRKCDEPANACAWHSTGRAESKISAVILSDQTAGSTQLSGDDPISEVHAALAFSSRDMAAGRLEAWLYGIVVGWDPAPEDEEDGGATSAMDELVALHGWHPEAIARLRRLHANWKTLEQAQEQTRAAEAKLTEVRNSMSKLIDKLDETSDGLGDWNDATEYLDWARSEVRDTWFAAGGGQ